MTERDRMLEQPTDPAVDPTRTEGLDPGAFVGQRPERQASTIPGGVGPKDERIAAHSTQIEQTQQPDGSREREAGQDR